MSALRESVLSCIVILLLPVVFAQATTEYRRWQCSGPMTDYSPRECKERGDSIGVYHKENFNQYECCYKICDGVKELSIDEERCESYPNCKKYLRMECQLEAQSPQVSDGAQKSVSVIDLESPKNQAEDGASPDPEKLPQEPLQQVAQFDERILSAKDKDKPYGTAAPASPEKPVGITVGIVVFGGIVLAASIVIVRKRKLRTNATEVRLELGEMNGNGETVEPVTDSSFRTENCADENHPGGGQAGTCSCSTQDSTDPNNHEALIPATTCTEDQQSYELEHDGNPSASDVLLPGRPRSSSW